MALYLQPSLKEPHVLSAMLSKVTLLAAVALVSVAAAGAANAQSATEIQLSYKDKKFDPAEISAPANTPIVIKLKNLDAKAMEFESKTLKIEKVVAGSTDATINVRAQKPGRYEFFDEYNEKVAPWRAGGEVRRRRDRRPDHRFP